MTAKNLPDANSFQNWREWANALVSAMTSPDVVTAPVVPETILLEHKLDTAGQPARPIVTGLVMYDPVLDKPVISVNGVWRTFTLDP